MLLFMIRLQDELNMKLWPFFIPHSEYLWNKIPSGKAMMSPEELFYDVRIDHQEI